MTWLTMDKKDLKAMLQALPQKLQTALASACAERVYKVWEENWVGNYTPSVKEAVDFGWEYATNPNTDLSRREALFADLDELTDYLNYEEIGILASAATVSQRVIESITDDNNASAQALERALVSALYVAKVAGQSSGQGVEEARQEELDWQEAALEIAKSWQGPCKRQMFDGIGRKPPKWWTIYRAEAKTL